MSSQRKQREDWMRARLRRLRSIPLTKRSVRQNERMIQLTDSITKVMNRP